ncbi:MAG: hypothetical protein ACQES8_05850 [Thermodesulfobacteriota bacterium]
MKEDGRVSLLKVLLIGLAGLVITGGDAAAGRFAGACLKCHTDSGRTDKLSAQEGNGAGETVG